MLCITIIVFLIRYSINKYSKGLALYIYIYICIYTRIHIVLTPYYTIDSPLTLTIENPLLHNVNE